MSEPRYMDWGTKCCDADATLRFEECQDFIHPPMQVYFCDQLVCNGCNTVTFRKCKGDLI
jgi:hypothetical protein